MVPLALQARVLRACRLRYEWLRDQPSWLHSLDLDVKLASYAQEIAELGDALASHDGLCHEAFHRAHWIHTDLFSCAHQMVLGMWGKAVDDATEQCTAYPVGLPDPALPPVLAICDAIPVEVSSPHWGPKQPTCPPYKKARPQAVKSVAAKLACPTAGLWFINVCY